jgi:hypothetical protein
MTPIDFALVVALGGLGGLIVTALIGLFLACYVLLKDI